MEDTLEVFLSKIASELEMKKPEAIRPDEEFRKMEEWNSMNALVILSFMNIEYGTSYTAEELGQCKTFREIYEVLKTKS